MQFELFTTCSHCGKEHPGVSTIVQTIHHTHWRSSTYPFCSQYCQQEVALGHMRELEGNYVLQF